MRYLLSVLLLPVLCAQEPEATQPAPEQVSPQQADPALKKLQAELALTAKTVDTAFTVRLREAGSPVSSNRGRKPPERAVTTEGSFHRDLQVLTIEEGKTVHLWQAGRDSIVRADAGGWRLGAKDPDSHASLRFVADPQRLLRMLSGMKLKIVARSIEQLRGRTCELVSVSLDPKQVEEMLFADVVLAADLNGKAMRDALAKQGSSVKVPPVIYDLVIAIDVRRRLVSSVNLRSIAEPVDMDRMMQLLMRRGGAGAADEDDVEEPEATRVKVAPLRYIMGMPKRSVEGMHVVTMDVDLRDHGKVEAPALDEQQRRLLGR
tara:strand:- start:2797 stop:3753 length:957 start_codon:yes stop_codon:yes gene_type:complete